MQWPIVPGYTTDEVIAATRHLWEVRLSYFGRDVWLQEIGFSHSNYMVRNAVAKDYSWGELDIDTQQKLAQRSERKGELRGQLEVLFGDRAAFLISRACGSKIRLTQSELKQGDRIHVCCNTCTLAYEYKGSEIRYR